MHTDDHQEALAHHVLVVRKALCSGDLTPEDLGFRESQAYGVENNRGEIKTTYGDYSRSYSREELTPNDNNDCVWLYAPPVKEHKTFDNDELIDRTGFGHFSE